MAGKKKRMVGDYEAQKGKGYYAMHRGWQDHPLFGNEPFSLRDAWIWLISGSIFSHEGKLRVICGKQVLLMRGQSSYSYRFLAEAWGWDDSKVDRFLKKLQEFGMIEIGAETGQSIITICNYNKYQIEYGFVEAGGEMPPRGNQVKGRANNKKVKNDNKYKNNSPPLRLVSSAPSSAISLPEEKWKKNLFSSVGETEYRAWLKDIIYKQDQYVYFPTEFIMSWCLKNYKGQIEVALSSCGYVVKGYKVDEKRNGEVASAGP